MSHILDLYILFQTYIGWSSWLGEWYFHIEDLGLIFLTSILLNQSSIEPGLLNVIYIFNIIFEVLHCEQVTQCAFEGSGFDPWELPKKYLFQNIKCEPLKFVLNLNILTFEFKGGVSDSNIMVIMFMVINLTNTLFKY